MATSPAARTLRTTAILSGATLLFTCICCYGCAAHTYANGPLAPQAPSDRQTTLWAAGAYLGMMLFVIAISALLLTISSIRRHRRMVRKAAQQRAAEEYFAQQPVPESEG